MLLSVAADYDLRSRDATAQTRGVADWAVLIELAVYAGVGVWALTTIRRRRAMSARVSDPAVSLFVGYGLFMAASAIWAPFPQLALARGGQLLVLVLLMWLIASTPSVRRQVLTTMAGAAVVVTTLSIPFGFVIRGDPGRFSWFLLHPIPAGIYLGISCMIMATVLANRQRWLLSRSARLGVSVLLLVHVAALLATISRGPIIATACGAVIVLWVSYPRHRRAVLVLGLGAIAVVGWAVFEEPLMRFFLRSQDVAAFVSLSGRTDLWAEAWELFKNSPLIGHGYGATRGLFLETIGLGGAHSMVVELMINGGLLAIGLFAALFISILTRMGRWTGDRSLVLPRDELALSLGIVTLLLVSGVAFEGAAATMNVLVVWLAVVVGWTASATTLLRQEARRAPTQGRAEHLTA